MRQAKGYLMKPLLAIAIVATACSPTPSLPKIDDHRSHFEVSIDRSHAFVYTRDVANTTGAGAIVNLAEQKTLVQDLGKGSWISNDVVMRSDGDKIFLIDRTNAAISILNPKSPATPERQFSVGQGTNPHDIARVGDLAYITRYDSTKLLVLDLRTLQTRTEIDFAKYSTPVDPYPEMSPLAVTGGLVWVGVQRWDRQPPPNWWTPATDGSYLVAIDPNTNTISREIKLTSSNPQVIYLDPRDGRLAVVEDSGIELINPHSGSKEGWLVQQSDFPFGINYSAITKDKIFVQTLDSWNWGSEGAEIYAIDRQTGEKRLVVSSPEGYFALSCLAVSPLNILVVCAGPGERVTKPGLRLFNVDTYAEMTTAPIDTGLPPFGVAFYSQEVSEEVVE